MKLKTLIISAALIAMPFAASAADLPIKSAAPSYAPAYNWSGFYIGANIGWLSGTSDITDQGYYDSGATASLKTNGFAGGGQAGYNWQMGALVTGVEVDGVGISGKKSYSGYYADYGTKWDALVTLRARAGLAVDHTLLYVTAGGAWASVKTTYNTNVVQGNFDGIASSENKWGWTAGVGIEQALTPNWSVKAEALFVRLEGNDTPLGTTTCNTNNGPSHACIFGFNNEAATVRFGANYKFR